MPHLNFPIGDGPISSKIFGLDDTGSGLDLVNLYYHQLVAQFHPNLVFKFECSNYMDNIDPFNISGEDVWVLFVIV